MTSNEINNLIYLVIKYGFGIMCPQIKDPPNELIKDIMLEIHNGDASVDTIVNDTMRLVSDMYSVILSDIDFKKLKIHCMDIADIFMQQPFEIRDDLGVDTSAEEFITKH